MKARIYVPTRTAMQSGQAKTHHWHLEIVPEKPVFVEPLMGWTGTADNTQQIRLNFCSKEEAIDYAKKNGLEYEIQEPKTRVIKPKSYAANFAFKQAPQ